MDILFIIGRVLFALIFINSGIGHLAGREAMTGYAKSKKIPAAGLAVVLSGVLILVCALALVLGVYVDLALLGLIIFLVPTAFLMHNFWTISDPMAKMSETVNFLKDLALAGAALLLFLIINNGTNVDFGPMLIAPFFS